MILKYTVQGTPYQTEIANDEELHQAIADTAGKIKAEFSQQGLKVPLQGSIEELLSNAIVLTEDDDQEIDLGEIPATPIEHPTPSKPDASIDTQKERSLREGENNHDLT
jgi:hypothetical protein